MKRVLKSLMFALLIMAVQVIIYKHYFGDAPDPIKNATMYKEFPAIPAEFSKKLKKTTELLNSFHAEKRLAAVDEVRRMGDKASELYPFLVILARDPDEKVQAAVLDAFDEIDDPIKVVAFIYALDDDDMRVKKRAMETLAKLGDKRAVEPLIELLDDEEWDVKFEASYTLKKLTGEDLGTDIKAWKKWHEENKIK